MHHHLSAESLSNCNIPRFNKLLRFLDMGRTKLDGFFSPTHSKGIQIIDLPTARPSSSSTAAARTPRLSLHPSYQPSSPPASPSNNPFQMPISYSQPLRSAARKPTSVASSTNGSINGRCPCLQRMKSSCWMDYGRRVSIFMG